MRKNKQIYIISFTRTANALNIFMQEKMEQLGYTCDGYTSLRLAEGKKLLPLDTDIRSWIGMHWGQAAFLIIGAVGIAVRSIAPWITDKYSDSAVIVMDEKGNYAIPLLSCHIGGAQDIAKDAAKCINAVLIATTATDVQNKFAVDVFARNNALEITDRQLAKQISAAILEDNPIGFYSEWPVKGMLPQGIIPCKTRKQLSDFVYGVAVTKEAEVVSGSDILDLHPLYSEEIVVGIGCRKDTSYQRIEAAVSKLMKKHKYTNEDISCIASISLKKDEKGILELSEKYKIPFNTYSSAVLQTIEEVSDSSAFVTEITGVDNVCERAARVCCPEGDMVQSKIIIDGIALALVKKQIMLSFDTDDSSNLRVQNAGKRILIFGGTTEGRMLIECLKKGSFELYISVATEYGKESLQDIHEAKLYCGRMNREEIREFIKAHRIQVVIDATHPFALEVSENVKNACDETSVEYLRCVRESKVYSEKDCNHAVWVSSVKEAAAYLNCTKGNILISTGSKELVQFTTIEDYQERCYARVLSVTEAVEASARLGFKGKHLMAMQGPFSKEMNTATIYHTNAKYLVTKESGSAGGLDEKMQACAETGAKMVIIKRQHEEGFTVGEIYQYCCDSQLSDS